MSCLLFTIDSIIVAGCDRRVVVYNREGRMVQNFDYSHDESEKEFAVALSNPSGQSVVVGSYDRYTQLRCNLQCGCISSATFLLEVFAMRTICMFIYFKHDS